MNILFKFLDFKGDDFLQIGSFSIKFYAICILLGILGAYIMGIAEAKKLGIPKYKILDGLLICLPFAIIGARIYYVLFSPAGVTYNSLWEVLDVRSGRSITGSIIVAVIFAVIYCRLRKMPLFSVMDLLAPGLFIGQIAGRWGNWFNGEAHGGLIESEGLLNFYNKVMPWVMSKMSTQYCDHTSTITGYYHPTFLYEGLWNTLGLVIMFIARRKSKKLKAGDLLGFYLLWYGFGRALLIEPFRTDQLANFLGIPANIIIPAVMAVLGLVFLILKHTVKKLNQPRYLDILENVKNNKIDTVFIRLEQNSYTTKLMDKSFFKKLFKNNYNILVYSKLNKSDLEKLLEENKIKEYVSNYQADVKVIDTLVHKFDNAKNILLISSNLNDLRNSPYTTCYFEQKASLATINNVDFKEPNYDKLTDDILFI